MRILIVCYSRTHTTETLAQQAATRLREADHEVTWSSLRPRLDLPYPLWLVFSFVPGSRFPLDDDPPDPSAYDACLLALPKWTFSCPPVNAFLARCGANLPPTAVLVTCGGWDEERYLRDIERRLAAMGVVVLGGLTAKRRHIEGGLASARLGKFLQESFRAGDTLQSKPSSRSGRCGKEIRVTTRL